MRTVILATAAVAFLLNIAYAQESATDAMQIAVGGSFAKPKVIPRMEKLALAQYTVKYKQVTTKAVTKNEKQFNGIGYTNKAAATAVLAAYLETTDGDLTDQDYQEITDYGYEYLQKKLKENGYDTVAWSAISNGDFFKEAMEDDTEKGDDNEAEEKQGQQWVTYNAFKGSTMYGGKLAFAFGKGKRATNYSKELDAALAFFNTTVDFVEIEAQLSVHTSFNHSYYDPKEITVYKSKTHAGTMMKIPSGAGISLFWNDKYQSETLLVTEDIPAEVKLDAVMTEDASKMRERNKLFSVSLSKRMESTPVVISTTREAYKAAAKKTLEKYADTFVAKAKELQKG